MSLINSSKSQSPTRSPGWALLRGMATLACVLVLLLVGFAGGVAAMWARGPELREMVVTLFPQTVDADQERSREERVQILWQIWDILDREYIKPDQLNPREMMYGAASGMVSSLGDPHTAFVEPVPAAILEEDMQGSFEGIGATVEMVEGRLVIARPLPSSPALKADLRAGDIVLEVDGQPLEGKTLLEAISLIRGPRGTSVTLLIQREGVAEPFGVAVVRDRIDLPIVESRMLDNDIGYLRLTEFNAVSEERVRTALKDLLGAKPRGIIFDLRGNPGGYLQMAIDISSEFLPEGTVILKEEERGKPIKEDRVTRSGIATKVPLVVLVNSGSASAAEIVAGAIQENQRGILIGERTYGKGSVQNTHRLQDGASLRVTIARWNLPSGKNLDGNGIGPDIQVSLTDEDVAADRDPQLERAVDYLVKGS
jgi:carboxyl-terminal processing protease